MQHLMTADDILTSNPGRFHLELFTVRDGVYRVEASYGGSVAKLIEELSASYADPKVAYGIFKALEHALAADGATVTSARRAVVQHLDGQLAFLLDNPSIQATNAAAYLQMVKGMFESPEDKQWADELAADMVAFHRALNGIADATDDNHSNPSNDDGEAASVQPQTMADTVPSQPRRQVRPTMAGAHLAPLTDAQRYALATAAQFDGVMLRGKYKPVHLLRALARKGFVTLNYRPGSRRPDPISATLTARGWREAVAVR
jgi:hypothetical protein